MYSYTEVGQIDFASYFKEVTFGTDVRTKRKNFLFVIIMNDIKDTDNTSPWCVIHTFNCYELKIGDFLKEKGVAYFIPMEYRVKKIDGCKVKKRLVPVVHNLVFVQMSMSEKELRRALVECFIPMYFHCKENSSRCYEIGNKEMQQFMLMCDPDYENHRFISLTEATLKVGSEVDVVYGPFKGVRGRLLRYHKQYYVLNAMMGVGVMIKVSRWCCRPCEW